MADKQSKKDFSILVVDDEPLTRKSLAEVLRLEGYDVRMAQDAETAAVLIKDNPVHLVIADIKLPQKSGLDLLAQIKEAFPTIDVILMTGHGTIGSAIRAVKAGAFDYFTKPLDDEEVKASIQKLFTRKMGSAPLEETISTVKFEHAWKPAFKMGI